MLYYTYLHFVYYIDKFEASIEQQLLKLIAYQRERLFYILSVCWTWANICDRFLVRVTYNGSLFSLSLSLSLSRIITFIRRQKTKSLIIWLLCLSPRSEESIWSTNIKSHCAEISFNVRVNRIRARHVKTWSIHSHHVVHTILLILYYPGNLVYL